METQVVFTRTGSVAGVVDRLIGAAASSIDAALYRLDSPRLVQSLGEASRRGLGLRLLLDRAKYEETAATRILLEEAGITFRVLSGHRGPRSKMHHKFAILDREMALTGSYNWTLESDENNHENLAILRDPLSVREFVSEFEALWAESAAGNRS